jgi:membrane protein YdbS with pleckstrin-like domain
MAKKVQKRGTRTSKKVFISPFQIYWKKSNYILLGAGFLILVIGFYLMSIDPWNSFPALVLSPIVIMIAYLVIFPAAIFYKAKTKDIAENTKESVKDQQ